MQTTRAAWWGFTAFRGAGNLGPPLSSRDDSLCSSLAHCLLGHSVVFWSLGISQTWVQIPHLTDLFPCSLCSLCPSHTVFSFFPISTSSCPMSGSLPRLSPLLRAPQAHPRAARAAPLSILLSSLAPCFSAFPTLITPGNDPVYVFLTVLYLIPLECTACERKDCVSHLFLCHQGLPFRYL